MSYILSRHRGREAAPLSAEQVAQLSEVGKHLGLAFQIKDDLFDFERVNWTGKPSGIDIKEQKMTLPLIIALRESAPAVRKKIIRTIKKHHDDPKKVAEVVHFVRESGGLAYARTKMQFHLSQAREVLSSFPASEARTALEELLEYTAVRKK